MKKLIATITLLLILFGTGVSQTTAPYDIWLTWTPNPVHELVNGYRIEYLKIPTITNWTVLTVIPATTNVAVIKNCQGGFIYGFRIFAINAIGIGTNFSNVVQIPTNTPSMTTGFSLTNKP